MLGLWFILCAPLTVAADSCIRTFLGGLTSPSEISVQDQTAMRSIVGNLHEYDIRILGAGLSGKVFRLAPKSGSKSFVIKTQGYQAAMNEFAGFKLVDKILGQHEVKFLNPQTNWHTLDLVSKPKKVAIQYEDIHGETLFSVLANDQVPTEVKKTLLKKYEHFVTTVQNASRDFDGQALTKKPADYYFPSQETSETNFEALVKTQPNLLWVSFPPETLNTLPDSQMKDYIQYLKEEGENFEILIKSDNFLVTPNMDLYWIDPI